MGEGAKGGQTFPIGRGGLEDEIAIKNISPMTNGGASGGHGVNGGVMAPQTPPLSYATVVVVVAVGVVVVVVVVVVAVVVVVVAEVVVVVVVAAVV